MPRTAVARMIARWTVPDPTEAHEVTCVVPTSADDLAWPPSND